MTDEQPRPESGQGMTSKVRDLLWASQRIAPEIDNAAAITNMVTEMLTAGESETFILLGLADALSDGLRHGNWPSLEKPS